MLQVVVATASFGVQRLGHACVIVPTGSLTREMIGGGSNCQETQSGSSSVARIITSHFAPRRMKIGKVRAYHEASR
jgi:hypothetical protein